MPEKYTSYQLRIIAFTQSRDLQVECDMILLRDDRPIGHIPFTANIEYDGGIQLNETGLILPRKMLTGSTVRDSEIFLDPNAPGCASAWFDSGAFAILWEIQERYCELMDEPDVFKPEIVGALMWEFCAHCLA